jgi:ankyrin repeat protein
VSCNTDVNWRAHPIEVRSIPIPHTHTQILIDFYIANLLYRHGAVVVVKTISSDADSQSHFCITPLFEAAHAMRLEAIQVLLEHNAETNLHRIDGKTSLCRVLFSHCSSPEGKTVTIIWQLLEHGADPNIPKIYNHEYSTALHQASPLGSLEVTRLLLSYGAR